MERKDRFDIIQPGISISSKYSTNGTLGLIVFDKRNNLAPSILSNWHVLAKSSWFPKISFKKGKPIYQPGRLFHGRDKSNIVAKLTRYNRETDSAIAEITNREFKLEQFESNSLITTFREPKVGDLVEKSGARTGVSQGRITEVDGSLVKIQTIELNNPNDLEISDGGDSGCIWYDPQTLEGLVLHNSGEKNKAPNMEFAKGYSLNIVLTNLEVALTRNV